MRRVTHPTGNVWLDISKKNDMHFIYAFFFENAGKVHVKVGQSTRPYKRLGEISNGSPFPVSEAVFCLAGSKGEARSFEERVRARLNDRRTRGEWYVFEKDQGKEFASIIRVAFAEATGRKLQWKGIDIEEFCKVQAAYAEKFHNRRIHAR